MVPKVAGKALRVLADTHGSWKRDVQEDIMQKGRVEANRLVKPEESEARIAPDFACDMYVKVDLQSYP